MKLVATDIDGTILPHGGAISERTVRTFRALAESGVPFVLVTARPPRWMGVVIDVMGDDGQAIIANGAAVMDLASKSVGEQITVSEAALLEAAAVLRAALPGVKLAVEAADGMSVEPNARRHSADLEPRQVAPFEELDAVRSGAALKILAHADGHGGADAMLAIVTPLLEGIVAPSHSAVDDSLLEFSPWGVSKASRLAIYAAAMGLGADDVVAFGDAPNDIPMLAWAGTSYAVGDGHPATKAAATHEAPAASADGVAQVLEELFDLTV